MEFGTNVICVDAVFPRRNISVSKSASGWSRPLLCSLHISWTEERPLKSPQESILPALGVEDGIILCYFLQNQRLRKADIAKVVASFVFQIPLMTLTAGSGGMVDGLHSHGYLASAWEDYAAGHGGIYQQYRRRNSVNRQWLMAWSLQGLDHLHWLPVT